jgi:hypothetical protein
MEEANPFHYFFIGLITNLDYTINAATSAKIA